jgi:hypothetical protein
MTPQEKNVFSKLFKTELGTHKVDLASVKELEKYLSDGKNQIAEIEKQGVILTKKLGEAINERRKFQDMVKSLKTLSYVGAKEAVDEFKIKAKDLGVDISNVPQLKDIEKLLSNTREYEAFDKSIPAIPNL